MFLYMSLREQITRNIMFKEHETYLIGIETDNERDGGFGSTGDK